MAKFEDLAKKIGSLVDEKNSAYGNSFEQAGDFLRLLYPNGIPPESYGDMLCVVRIFDKLKRIATNKGAFSESPYQDIVGYGLLGVDKDLRSRAVSTEEDGFQTVAPSEVSPVGPDPVEQVNVNCQLCGQFVGLIPAGSPDAKNPFVHEHCWNTKKLQEQAQKIVSKMPGKTPDNDL